MDIRKLQRTIVDALEDVKAQDIQVFNTEALTSLFDRVVVATGSSNRQTRALAASVRDRVKAAGGQVRSPEGDTSGEWVLVDCGDAVVHVMQPMIRAYYKLEDIWGGKTVHLKGKDAAQAPTKPATTARKTTAGRSAAGKTASGKTAASKTAPSKTAPSKTAPSKTAPSKTAPSKTAPSKTASRKTAASKTAASRAAPRKTAAARTRDA